MIEAVARHGYSGTTLRELVRLAGVSKSTFYDHFQSKEEAFLATSDEVTDRMAERVDAAYGVDGNPGERLFAALTAYLSLAANESQAATLATVETLALGKVGLEHREQGTEALEAVLRESFDRSPSPVEVQPIAVQAIASGIRGVVYRKLREGTPEELPTLVEEVVEWVLGYQRPENETVRRAAAAAAEPGAGAAEATGGELDWNEPPDSERSRAELSQRERILRAVARLVVEKGYRTMSIPAISATAGTSNQTFYEHFDNKREAFLATFDIGAAGALSAFTKAFDGGGNGPEAVGAGLRGLLDYFATNRLFAHITFFDLLTAGPVALDRADAAMESFTAFLGPGLAPEGVDTTASAVTLQAIASGTWSVIHRELAHRKIGSLPALAPELVRIVLMPLTTP
jgi:AcrR family transcriptional regulator